MLLQNLTKSDILLVHIVEWCILIIRPKLHFIRPEFNFWYVIGYHITILSHFIVY